MILRHANDTAKGMVKIARSKMLKKSENNVQTLYYLLHRATYHYSYIFTCQYVSV